MVVAAFAQARLLNFIRSLSEKKTEREREEGERCTARSKFGAVCARLRLRYAA